MVEPGRNALNVVVTGASGYVGSVLTPLLEERGHRVTRVDIRKPEAAGNSRSADSASNFIKADIRDGEAMTAALSQADAIIHLAAVVGYPACDAEPGLARAVNEMGTRVVAESAPQCARFVFASTCSVYGHTPGALCSEDDPIQPMSLYAETKARAEKVALARGAVVLRPSTAFGASSNFRTDLILHDFVLRGLRGDRLRLFQPHAIRSFVYVEDMARAAIFAVERYQELAGRAFNVSAPDGSLSKLDLARRIAEATRLSFDIDDDRQDPDGRDYRVDTGRLAAAGFASDTGFDERLQETVTWMWRRFGARYGIQR